MRAFRRQDHAFQFEDLRGGAAVRLDEVNGQIDQRVLRRPRSTAQHEGDCDPAADWHAARRNAHLVDRDRRLRAETEEPEHVGIAALHGASQRVLDEIAALGGRVRAATPRTCGAGAPGAPCQGRSGCSRHSAGPPAPDRPATVRAATARARGAGRATARGAPRAAAAVCLRTPAAAHEDSDRAPTRVAARTSPPETR